MILKNIKTFSTISLKKLIKQSTVQQTYRDKHYYLKPAIKMIQQSNRYYLHQKDQRFLRFVEFDVTKFNEIPFFFKPLEPLMTGVKQTIMNANSFLGLPWWIVLILSSAIIRLTIFPLIVIQMRRITKLAPISPVFVMIKDTWRQSQLSKYQKIKTILNLYRIISKRQNIKFRSIFIYNMAYYPLLIAMIFSMRKLLANPQVASTSFIYLNNLSDIDPYFILPALTIGLYYWNFQRFITKENRNTLLSKMRILCQYFLILWFPYLCCWPSGIVLYMCTNALVSVLQTNALKSPWFLSKINEKMTYYNFMLNSAQYDTSASDSVIQSIKRGGQSLKLQQIKQQDLFEQTKQMVNNLNKELNTKQAPNACQINMMEKNQQISKRQLQQKLQKLEKLEKQRKEGQ